MIDLAEQVAKQLQDLNNREKELINLNSESLTSSRHLDIQFKELFGKKGGGIQSFHLPSIKKGGQMETSCSN